MPVCEDCGQAYAPPVYYSTETGTLCPKDAGPYLDPDNDNDPRRPTIEDHERTQDERWSSMIVGEWVPINASQQTCLHCDAVRDIPADCVGEHYGCGEGEYRAHHWHYCTEAEG